MAENSRTHANEDRFGEDFWELHPNHPDRVALRNWIDTAFIPAADAIVHGPMQRAYDATMAEIAAAEEASKTVAAKENEVAAEVAAEVSGDIAVAALVEVEQVEAAEGEGAQIIQFPQRAA